MMTGEAQREYKTTVRWGCDNCGTVNEVSWQGHSPEEIEKLEQYVQELENYSQELEKVLKEAATELNWFAVRDWSLLLRDRVGLVFTGHSALAASIVERTKQWRDVSALRTAHGR